MAESPLDTFRDFPILTGGKMPWDMLAPHEQQAKRNHGGQSLAQLMDRGGLSWAEALCVLRDEPAFGNLKPEAEARIIVAAMIESWSREHE